MRTYTDEQLTAYADGELPAAEARTIAEAARADAALARRIARFTETRRLLQEAFGDKLREPVPQRFLDLLAGDAAAGQAARDKVVPLVRPARGRPRAWLPTALAASLALAVGLSVSFWRTGGQGAPPAVAGLPPDAAALRVALEHNASGVPAAGESGGLPYEILPTSTLRTAQGGYCREFESTHGAASARGLACRDAGGAWATVAVASAMAAPASGDTDYAPAGGSGPDFAAALGAATRLTPAEETAAIGQQWATPAAKAGDN